MAARADYRHFLSITTRWKDNDVYGHVHNVEYYSYFDTVINTWLINEGGLDIHRGAVIGLCAESHCRCLGPLAFPETIDAGLRVEQLAMPACVTASACFDLTTTNRQQKAGSSTCSSIATVVVRRRCQSDCAPPCSRCWSTYEATGLRYM